MWLLQQGIVQHIRTYERDYWPNDNVIMMSAELGMANQFSNDLSVDVKRGMRQKAERGWNPQRKLAIGYQHNTGYSSPEKKGEPEIVSTSDLEVVKKLFSAVLSGNHSVPDIQRLAPTLGLVNKNGNPYSYNAILDMLRNPMYYGTFQWQNSAGGKEWHKGKHEAILTENQFNQVQTLLGAQGRSTRINHYQFAFRGPLSCGECGGAITAERKRQCICTGCKHKFSCITATACPRCGRAISEMHTPTLIDKTYYHCTKQKKGHACSQKSIEEKELHAAIAKILQDIKIDKDFYQWAKLALQDVHRAEVGTQKEIAKRTTKKRDDLTKRLNNLLLMRADKEITSTELQSMKAEIENELHAVEREHKALDQRALHWVEIADGYLTFTESVCTVFNTTDDLAVKREILQTLGSNLEIIDKNPRFTVIKPLVELQNIYVRTHKDLGTFEPEKYPNTQGYPEQKKAAFSLLRAGLQELRTAIIGTDYCFLPTFIKDQVNGRLDTSYPQTTS